MGIELRALGACHTCLHIAVNKYLAACPYSEVCTRFHIRAHVLYTCRYAIAILHYIPASYAHARNHRLTHNFVQKPKLHSKVLLRWL